MVQQLSETTFKKATDDQLNIMLHDIPTMIDQLLDAPIVMEEAKIFAVIDDIAYPLYELAEATKDVIDE